MRTLRQNEWYLVSSHGAVLFCIAADQGCTVKDLADRLCLTRRTVWGVIGDLRRTGMLKVKKNGRVNHYSVNLDAPFRHPTIEGHSLRPILTDLIRSLRDNGRSPAPTVGDRDMGLIAVSPDPESALLRVRAPAKATVATVAPLPGASPTAQRLGKQAPR